MTDKKLPSLFERHWAESALAIGAIVITAVSLWVAYDTLRTNRELVAATSWPFVQVLESDSDGPPATLSLTLLNSGIGPAKIESFQLFWHGQPQSTPGELLRHCCQIGPGPHQIVTSSDEDIVLRAGQSLTFLRYTAGANDAATWQAFRKVFYSHGGGLGERYCYCSAFNQCWQATLHSGQPLNLNPPRVAACLRPKVTFENFHYRHP